jgi:FkbM family methyltransferase
MKFQHGWAFPDADVFMLQQISESGDYQRSHLDAALKHVTDWSIAIDGGGHVGTFANVLSARFARVITVEPSPDTFECLQWNLAERGCVNVEARNVALGDAPGFVAMTLTDDQRLKANTGARFAVPGGTIPVEQIDTWQLPSLGLLKLDVEGAEYVALRGAEQTLRRCRPIVLFENKWLWTRHYGIAKDAVSKFLTKLNYHLVDQVCRDQIWAAR